MRPLRLTDARHFERHLLGDTEAILRTAALPDPCTEKAAATWIKSRLAMGEKFGVWLRSPEEFIGVIGLVGTGRERGVGYWIARSYWNQGYATEALQEIIGHAKATGVAVLVAETFPENPPSARVLQKVGFSMEGLAQREYPERGGVREVLVHRLELAG